MRHQQLGGLGSLPSTWRDSCALCHRWFSPSPSKLFCQKKNRVSVLEWVPFCIKDVALNGFRYREDLMLGFSHSQDKCLATWLRGGGWEDGGVHSTYILCRTQSSWYVWRTSIGLSPSGKKTEGTPHLQIQTKLKHEIGSELLRLPRQRCLWECPEAEFRFLKKTKSQKLRQLQT